MKDLITASLPEAPARRARSARGERPRSRAFARVLDTAQRLDAAHGHSNPHARLTPDEQTLSALAKSLTSKLHTSSKESSATPGAKKKKTPPDPTGHAEAASLLTLRAERASAAGVVEQGADKLARLQRSSPLGTHARIRLQERAQASAETEDSTLSQDVESADVEIADLATEASPEGIGVAEVKPPRVRRARASTRPTWEHGLGGDRAPTQAHVATERAAPAAPARPAGWAEQVAQKFQAAMQTTARGGWFEIGLQDWTGEDGSLRLQVQDGTAELVYEFKGVEPTLEVQRALEEMRRVLEESGLELGEVTYERSDDKDTHTQQRHRDESDAPSEDAQGETPEVSVPEVSGLVHVVV